MNHRRLVGIDLGIATAHTVRVLDGEGNDRGQAQGLAHCGEPDRGRGGGAGRVPGGHPAGGGDRADRAGVAADRSVLHRAAGTRCSGCRRRRPRTCAGSCPGTPRPTASTPTPWPGCRCSTRRGCGRCSCPAPSGPRWTGGSAPPTGSPARPPSTRRRIKDLVRQLLPISPLTGDLGAADLAVLERYADPRALLSGWAPARLTALIARASNDHQGAERARQWLDAAHASLELYGGHPAVEFTGLAAEVATEVRLLHAT